jgi:TPR repeat protein
VTELLEKARAGEAEAQHNPGMRAAYGMGMERDEAEAMRWYRKAAEQGSADAQFNLGSMYGNGQGVARDLVQAYAWFTLSQRAGSAPAAEYMGRSARSLDAEERARAAELAREFAMRYRPAENRP